jgi:predicted DNA-binding WGR domain protein
LTSGKRRFEFVQGSSNKFWEIAITGPNVAVRFGRIGSSGQSETKSFADPAAALRHADKKIAEKLNKGYVEVG